MTKIWGATFWGEEKESQGRAGRAELATTGVVLVLSLAVAAAAGPLGELSLRAATDLMDPGVYVSAVLGGG